MTTTSPIMLAWSVPQNCEQNSWYVPTRSALNHSVSYCPGSTSRLTRKAGTKKSWMTSSRRHDQLDRRVDRHVQRVDLALAAGVLDLPHPLLGDDVDLQGIAGRLKLADVDDRSPDEQAEEDRPVWRRSS